jgi:putative transposase
MILRQVQRRLGRQSVAPNPSTARPAPGHPVYPYLLRGLAIVRPNQVWCTDITYIRLAHGFVYLTAVMDGYSRYVLSWEVSVTLAEECCISALQSAWRGHGRSEIFNSDQGAQFTSQALTAVLTAAEVRISRDGKGRAIDNIRVERLWCPSVTACVTGSCRAGCSPFNSRVVANYSQSTGESENGLDWRWSRLFLPFTAVADT